jgi:copper chaperone CopZ
MKTTLAVQGMTCPSCVRHVTQALTVPGVAKVAVRLSDGSVEIEHDTSIGRDRMIALIVQAGYEIR